MLRIFRCKASELDLETKKYLENASMWETELSEQLGADYANLIASPKFDGEYVNFYTRRSGEISELDINNQENLSLLLEQRRNKLISFLESNTPLHIQALESDRNNFKQILKKANVNYALDKSIPVIIPLFDNKKTSYEDKASVVTPPPVPPTSNKKGCLWPFLLGLLLLLLLLALLWYFFLRPWPFSDTNSKVIEPVANAVVKNEKPKAEVKVLEPVKEEPKAEIKIAEPEKEEPKALETKPTLPQEKLPAKAEMEVPVPIEPKQELTEKKDTKATAKPAKAKDTLKAEKPVKQEKAKPQKALTTKTPKCKELKVDGKMPRLAIALDSSPSMTLPYGSSGDRMTAAKNAANQILNNIDKNVDIGFVQIHTCPEAFNHGFYSSNRRNVLASNIRKIQPLYQAGTPLVSGLNTMARMLGNDAGSVGILISDGEDTCPLTENFDICNVASNIHKKYPKLKIHAILIGEDSYRASCVAKITGGKVYKPNNAQQINQQLKDAASSMKKVCEE